MQHAPARHNWCLIVLLIIIAVGIFCLSGVGRQWHKERSLAKFYERLVAAEQSYDLATIYGMATYEARRMMPFEEYVAWRDAGRAQTSLDVTVHSMRVEGDVGYIDRSIVVCFTEECEGDDRFEERLTKVYLYINGAWYAPDNNSLDEAGNPTETEWPLADEDDAEDASA